MMWHWPAAWRNMKRFKEMLKWFVLMLALLPFLYVGAYLVLVKRTITRGTIIDKDRNGERSWGEASVVIPEAPTPKWAANWYLPLAKLDNTHVRTHHWDSYVVLTNTGEKHYLGPAWALNWPKDLNASFNFALATVISAKGAAFAGYSRTNVGDAFITRQTTSWGVQIQASQVRRIPVGAPTGIVDRLPTANR